ncbi:hypothetical protein M408DRAFT_19111, partial [Serendipita vermifera MAFF 305830]
MNGRRHHGHNLARLELHEEYLQVPTGLRPRNIPFSSPEEEAAHLFLYIPTALDTLIQEGVRSEFPVIGHHFERAFNGTIDKVEAIPHEDFILLRLHEVKTTIKESLSRNASTTALLQASLYAFFMEKLLQTSPHFDFETYFAARGLDIRRPFTPKFGIAFLNHQVPGMNPSGSPPNNLESLVRQWRKWIRTLPKLKVDKYVYITALRPGQVSSIPAFWRSPEVRVRLIPHEIDIALRKGRTVIDILDGSKLPGGMDKRHILFCKACPYHTKCPWTPELHNEPITHLLPVYQQTPTPTFSKLPASVDLPLSMLPSPKPPSDSSLVKKLIERELQDARRRRHANLLAELESLRLSQASKVANNERKRSAVAEELECLRREREAATSVE